jgi:hypothetical protein
MESGAFNVPPGIWPLAVPTTAFKDGRILDLSGGPLAEFETASTALLRLAADEVAAEFTWRINSAMI